MRAAVPALLVAALTAAAGTTDLAVARGRSPGVQVAEGAVPASEWRTLEGRWSATGRRDTLPTEHGADAAVVHLSGAVTLTTSTGLSRGFQGAFVGFFDGRALGVGRAVWTDQHGDRVFAEYRGGPLRPGSSVTLAITGGTGRYEGIAGELTLAWQTVVQEDDHVVHVRSTTLKGRYRFVGGPQ